VTPNRERYAFLTVGRTRSVHSLPRATRFSVQAISWLSSISAVWSSKLHLAKL